jgi:NRPS condensation-like uncharacterized protein
VRKDHNIFTKGKEDKEMSGVMNISSSPALNLDEIKTASKKLGATINDVILCALTTSINTIFKE